MSPRIGSAEGFLTDYYEHVADDDVRSYSSDTLLDRARYHRSLAERRTPGQAVVGILNEAEASIVAIVTDDMPYLVPSITAEITRDNTSIRLLVHPTFSVSRDTSTHALSEVRRGPSRAGLPSGNEPSVPAAEDHDDGGRLTEAWIAVEISRLPDDASAERLVERLQAVVGDVRAASKDSAAIDGKLDREIRALEALEERLPAARDTKELLTWLGDGNFVFLGYREPNGRRGLGLLRDKVTSPGAPEVTRRKRGPGLGTKPELILSKSTLRSTVLRRAYLDEITMATVNENGERTTECTFVGLFAPSSASRSALQIPVIRDTVKQVLESFNYPPNSHDGKELLAVLEAYPRDELFHIDARQLAAHVGEILRLQERHSTRLFLRPDSHGRFMTALVFLPRHRLSSAVRLNIERELREAFGSDAIEFELRLGESDMARLFFRILLPDGGLVTPAEAPDAGPVTAAAVASVGAPAAVVDPAILEQRIIAATRSWAQGLDEALQAQFPAKEAARLSQQWVSAFPPSYKADYAVEDAVDDIARFESFGPPGSPTGPDGDPLLTIYRRPGTAVLAEDARIRLYLTRPQSLTQILPFFHNLGLQVLDQRPFDVHPADGRAFFLYDLGLKYPRGVDPLATGELLQDSFRAAMRGDVESDAFDALVLREGIDWRRTAVLRAYSKYLRQLGSTNSYGFIADTLLENVRASNALLELFEAKFDPDRFEPDLFDPELLHATSKYSARQLAMDAARAKLAEAIDAVPVLDADRLLRSLASLVEATLRTNFYLGKPYLSFKLDPSKIPAAPAPRPKFEIWVYSPRVEGVHLRFGLIARGGLRWSDRREDFRTEVLGLVKAQTVKNAVIVPTGAKGGFYPKQLPDPAEDRAAWFAEGQECYRTFIRGLLDITDNLVAEPGGSNGRTAPPQRTAPAQRTVPPARVVRHDGDDYYLVVAADKGTATFSDIANALASEYGFWLGDAFASGGSVGYDHKQMGITARGAWESVRHHFRDLLMDSDTEDFTVVGIGDMSGDVFGNGMLLSKHIKLVAAFDHRHIFLDPTPDPAISFAERKRLFKLPRSSWADYRAAKISPGGGVYSRLDKSIPVSEPVRRALGLASDPEQDEGTTAMSPPELLKAILTAPVDLLYNGGIGTYVKASTETHGEVGDKANDAIRVNAGQLRTRIIAEGGNLGVTQRGRIEAALAGILVNSDAIDNSAGVDCSDHEVNIKIFLDRMIAAGKMPAVERAAFLHSLEDEVGRLVLKTNVDQNVLLLNDRQLVLKWSPSFERTMDWLETVTDLDRDLECLPTTRELQARVAGGTGLTSPELAVLAAYAKIELSRELTEGGLADDPWFSSTLRGYFPRRISERFGEELFAHPLRRQIVATVVANDMINFGGIAFAFRTMEETTVSAVAVARGFVVMRQIWDFDSVMDAIARVPANVPSEHACAVALDMRRLLDRSTRWYVTHDFRDKPIADAMARLEPPMAQLRSNFTRFLHGMNLQHSLVRLANTDAQGIPHELGIRASELLVSYGLLDISAIAEELQEPAEAVAEVYFAVFERISAIPLLEHITLLPRETHWEALARAALRDDMYLVLADMTKEVVRHTPRSSAIGTDPVERIMDWEHGNIEQLARIQDTIQEAIKPGPVDIAALSVAVKLLRAMVRH
ncbi:MULTISPECIES: NAD-glutamate dehydrogenase [Arthrobacter]|uniref:NAD-glutamate dehydrogenase n=1 Tax=Arthrobacter terricola TaxID=2547396 RepID=A0A4R5KS04_9MICC|nr:MULTISPECIES: NAD-glutamate dehydrogenase [Arthrobacter]MBT8160563.1 NAD-glutamate dehydrogenase [Arthrobacter sp. GN70]TDF98406.1 NAD-glutamate dehydrogenase [Arthrobacter terricola]